MRSFRIQLQENINSPSTFDELSEALAQIYFQCRFHEAQRHIPAAGMNMIDDTYSVAEKFPAR